ncbi:MAG: serine hydrolase [Thermoleophilia bacterium]
MSPAVAPPPPPIVAPAPVVFGRIAVRVGRNTTRIQAVTDGRSRLAIPVPRGPRTVSLRLPTGRWNLRVRAIGPGGVRLSRVSRLTWVLPASGHKLGTTQGRLDRRLQADLVRLTGRLPAISGVYAQHLVTGCGAGVNAAAPFPTASVLKAGILLDAVRRPAGASSSLLDRMIIDSNDLAANQVLAIQGGGDGVRGATRVTETLRLIGLREALVRRPYIIEEASRPIPIEATARPALYTNYIGSPLEMARMFVVIHRSAIGGTAARRLGIRPADARRELTRRFLEVRDRTKFAQGLPDGMPLLHKTGYTEQVKHDVGVVYTRSGPIVVAAMTWSASGVGDAVGDGFAADVMRAVVRRLAASGGRC